MSTSSVRVRPDALPRFRTPSGGLVSIEAEGYDLGDPWFATFQVEVQRPYASSAGELRTRYLEVAPLGNSDFLIDRLLRGRVTERVVGQGGTLLVARSDVDGKALAVWQGRWHEVFSWLNEPGASGAQALRRFERLTFQDSPLGVTVRTERVPAEEVLRENVRKRIPGVGFLHIVRGANGADLVPTWAGAAVRTGEVWRKHFPAGDGVLVKLIHASPTAVTVLSSDDDRDDETPRLDFLDRLSVLRWTDQ